MTVQEAFASAYEYQQAGRLEDAEDLYLDILDQLPEQPDVLHNLGLIAFRQKRFDEAIDLIRRAVAGKPEPTRELHSLAAALMPARRFDEAVATYRRLLELDPHSPTGYFNLGNALFATGNTAEAIECFQAAVARQPTFAEAYGNLGTALRVQRSYDQAIQAYEQALAIKPDFVLAHFDLGNCLRLIGRLPEAIACYRRAVAIDPDHYEAQSCLAVAINFDPAYDPHAILAETQRCGRRFIEQVSRSIGSYSNTRQVDRPLRVGYLSPDFREHVVAQNLLPLLEAHDRGQFEITCYSCSPVVDEMTAACQKHADRWRDLVDRSDEQAAGAIRADQIDILVDLALWAPHNRLPIFARRPAPVQVTYLGYCGTTGLTAIDYRLSDHHLDPPQTDLSCYSEKTVRLPRSYWCYRPKGPSPEPSPPPWLHIGHITFGSLNNFTKVSPLALDTWSRIMAVVPDSKMILHAPLSDHLQHVIARFEHAGVSAERLRFVNRMSWEDFVQLHAEIDVMLDSFPYAGGITTCDALWMGVPVVSLSGNTAVGRGGRSILANIGRPELIANDPDQYVQIAVDLARGAERLSELRRGMRERMLASPLLDAKTFTLEVEAAYREMWRTWCGTA